MPENHLTQKPLEIPTERISATEQAGGAFVLLALTWLVSILGWLTTRRPSWLAPVLGSSAIAGGILWIFRNPTRQPASNGRAVLVPNDGFVRRVAMVQEERFLHGPAMCITIQVSARNVQITRAPLGGTVRLRRYEPVEPTQRTDDGIWLGIKSADATRVALHQSASPLWRRVPSHWARRILLWPDLEDVLQGGQEIGHLTLGGMVKVYVPCTATICVRAGQAVVAGETILATLPVV